jgi:L-ectoine synthase
MKIVRLRDLVGTDRDIGRETFRSRRFLLASDGQGYSFHETRIRAGTELHMWYKNHVETVYCIAGDGELEDLATGEIHTVHDGMLYCLNDHDRHVLRATTDLRLICVFTPALLGPELHDEDGSFALLDSKALDPIVEPARVIEQAEEVAKRVADREPGTQSNAAELPS